MNKKRKKFFVSSAVRVTNYTKEGHDSFLFVFFFVKYWIVVVWL